MIHRSFVTRVLAALLAAGASAALAQSSPKIPLSQLEDMFSGMRAKTKWNVDGPLLWGYFFIDSSEENLKRASTELANSGYKVVVIRPVDGEKLFRLHVERVETHSPASLHTRNTELEALARRWGLASYDGMDVGPVPPASR